MKTVGTAARRDHRTDPTWPHACRGFAASAVDVVGLLARHELKWPRTHVGQRLLFEDGTVSRVFRETVLDAPTTEPALLVVQFRLRGIGRARLAHRLFRVESIANTPLFAGFPGFRSKLWLCDDETGAYRGLYEWDGAERAVAYAETLSMLLRAVSEPGTVKYRVVARTRRDRYIAHPAQVTGDLPPDPADTWWRLRHTSSDRTLPNETEESP